MDGESHSVLWVRSAQLPAGVIKAHLGEPELLQQKGALMRNGTTRFEVSAWLRTFSDHSGDDFNEALREAISFLRENDSAICALRLLDPDLVVSIDLMFDFKRYDIGGVVDADLLKYCFVASGVAIGVHIYRFFMRKCGG